MRFDAMGSSVNLLSGDVGLWPWINGSGLQLGSGFDTLRFEPCASAVQTSPLDGQPSNIADGQKITYSVDLIENEREYRRSLDINACVSFKNLGGSASARLEIFKSVKLNSYNVFLLASVSVVNATRTLNDPHLKDTARQEWLAAKDGNKRANFVKIYGDVFVESVTEGGELFVLFELTANSSEERERIKLSVSGSMGAWSASANYEEAIEEINKYKRTKLLFIRDGGLGEPLPSLGIQEILAEAQNFPAKVKDHPVPIFFQTQRYSRVPDTKSSIDVEAVDATRRLEDLAEAYDDLQTRRASLKFVGDNLSIFKEVDKEEIDNQLAQIDDMQIQLSRLAEDTGRFRFGTFQKNDYPTIATLPREPKIAHGTTIPIAVKLVGVDPRDAKIKLSREGAGDQWIGGDMLLTSFVIICDALAGETKLQYFAHLGGIGDSQWFSQGEQTLDVVHEGIGIKVVGPDAHRYTVSYQVQRYRGTASYYGQNGAFAGTRQQYMRIAGIRVALQIKD